MVATGLCHTDLYVAHSPLNQMGPMVLGHEGAGEVLDVGPEVTVAKKGELVLLSYASCGECGLCGEGRGAYCERFLEENITGLEGDIFTRGEEGVEGDGKGEGKVLAKFFGQSSFAGLSVVGERSVVNVSKLGVKMEELKLLAPLGCGLQTGAGSVVNAAKAGPSDVLLVTGLGGVGMGAVMGGVVSKCRAVIAVDRVKSRLDTAKELGATHAFDTTGIKNEDLAAEIHKLVEGKRISIAVETTGVPTITDVCIKALGKRGHFLQVGIPSATANPDAKLEIPWADFWNKDLILESTIEGSSVPLEFVPKMIEWWREGKFPIEKLVETFDAKDVEKALEGMHSGKVIKPVLVW